MDVREQLRPYVLAWRRIRRGDVRMADLAYGRETSFSQFGEDIVLAELFREQEAGFYVDVGAYDPHNASNTYLLYRQGWRGINIEPNPEAWDRFGRLRKRDLNLRYAVTAISGPVRLTNAGSFSAIVDGDDADDAVLAPGRPLQSILADHLPAGQHIDLLDVDCEGHDLVVLQTNDWEKYRPSVVLAEWHDGAATAIPAYLESVGYELLLRLGPTGVFVAANSRPPRRSSA